MSVASDGLRQLLEGRREEQLGGTAESDEGQVAAIEEVLGRKRRGQGGDEEGDGGDDEMGSEEERRRLMWKMAALKYRSAQKRILDKWIEALGSRDKRKRGD